MQILLANYTLINLGKKNKNKKLQKRASFLFPLKRKQSKRHLLEK